MIRLFETEKRVDSRFEEIYLLFNTFGYDFLRYSTWDGRLGIAINSETNPYHEDWSTCGFKAILSSGRKNKKFFFNPVINNPRALDEKFSRRRASLSSEVPGYKINSTGVCTFSNLKMDSFYPSLIYNSMYNDSEVLRVIRERYSWQCMYIILGFNDVQKYIEL